ncbi:unnamed protein product [Adineta ricciae]|uniref:Plus3 domain-containing protein n=1 Tax=Adineta ricciae TaxID=249248 RepID=A0A814P5Z7_ADIRI|nr:unnamed protein product [Adineta ricciae]
MSKNVQRKRQRKSSDSDSDSDGDQSRSKKVYADGYDDEYRGNTEDRAWLDTLTERERETELLKRHEQREILSHREEITKKLKSKQKSGTDNDTETKTKSSLFDDNIYADDDEDDYRSSGNRRQQANASKQKETQHSKTLQALIEKRKKKQDEDLKKSQPKSANRLSDKDEASGKITKINAKEKYTVREIYSSSSSDDEDDNRYNRHRRSRSPDHHNSQSSTKEEDTRKSCTPITEKSQLKSMVLSRFRMEKWCHAPFFPKVAKGAFVRINIGQHNGAPVYRVCEIRDVVETAKVYNLGATRTNKGLRLKHGDHERVFRLEFVSNSEISDKEFQRWREAVIKRGMTLPTLKDMKRKVAEIDECKQHVLSNADITKIVQEKSRFRKVPINYAMAKNELLKEIDIAVSENDLKRESELRQKLEETEKRASELDRKRSQNISAIAQINQRNRKNTQENIEMALAREALEHANAAADPFTRRRCAPVLVTKAPQTKEELIRELHSQRAAEEQAAAAKKKTEEQRLAGQKNAVKTVKSTLTRTIDTTVLSENGLPSMTTHERGSFTMLTDNSDEIFTSHNFELDFNMKLLSE